jgi:hypothetical protein
MNPRNQSGYDPVGDPRTGRPPLPDERDRMREESSSAMRHGDGSGVARSLREAGEAVSSRVTEATEQGSALASAASGQIQNYTEDLLAFARRRPFAALLGAAVVGLLIGLLSRRA